MEDRYTVLESLKKRLVSINIFSSASDEMKVLDEAMDLVLDAETTPNFAQEQLIELQIRLNQCERVKNKATTLLKKHEDEYSYLKLFDNKKIGIVGGHPTDIKNLKKGLESRAKGAKITFRETYDGSPRNHKKLKEKYRGMDLIVALTGYTGHALTRHVDMLEKEVGIHVIRVDGAPKDISDLFDEIVSLLREP
jgi:hypothetical protein